MGTLAGTDSFGGRFTLDGESYDADRDLPVVRFAAVTPGFRETFDFEVSQGRWLETTDNAEAPPVIAVNEAFVERHFPDGQAIGRSIRLGGVESTEPWREIVGVVPNHRMEGVGSQGDQPINAPGFYIPLAQYDLGFASIAARVEREPRAHGAWCTSRAGNAVDHPSGSRPDRRKLPSDPGPQCRLALERHWGPCFTAR